MHLFVAEFGVRLPFLSVDFEYFGWNLGELVLLSFVGFRFGWLVAELLWRMCFGFVVVVGVEESLRRFVAATGGG